MRMVETQEVARKLVAEFVDAVEETGARKVLSKGIQCVRAKVAKFENPDGSLSYYTVERLLKGDFVKYNNNCGYVNHLAGGAASDLLQAFSHWSHKRTQGSIMVVDLQVRASNYLSSKSN